MDTVFAMVMNDPIDGGNHLDQIGGRIG